MLPPNRCAFHNVWQRFGWPPCDGPLQRHHVLNKTFLSGNRRARRLVEGKYRRMLMRWVCRRHNTERYADSKAGRRFLLGQFPRDEVEKALEEIEGCFKTTFPNLL